MFKAYGKFWKNLFSFKEPTSRKEFWWPLLFNYLLTGVLVGISQAGGPAFLKYICYAALAVLGFGTLTCGIRRYRETGYPATHILFLLIPLGGLIYLIIILSRPKGAYCTQKGHHYEPDKEHCRKVCSRCGDSVPEHSYEGCKCTVCGDVRDKHHAFTVFDKEHCTESCEKCGKTQHHHSWEYCKCSVCGKHRNDGHDFKPQPGSCMEACSVCGKEREGKHSYGADGICTVCGKKKPTEFNLSTLANTEYESVKFALDIIGKTPGLDNDLKNRCRTLHNQLSPQKKLDVVDMTTVVTASILVGKAISSDSKAMNGTDLNAMINKMHLINLTGAITKLNGIIADANTGTTSAPAQPAKASEPAAPAFTKKPLTAFRSYDESYNGYIKGGVCDVCNKPLEGKKAYAVDNGTFYDSPDYYAHLVKLQKDVFGLTMTRADYEQRRKMDTSPGSAVCENCMHMFAVMPGDKSSASDAAIFYEADNVGSRPDNMSKATGYWLGERPNKAVKPPFTMYVMPSLESGEAALLALPFFHRAQDSGKIVSERLMTYGVYAVTENGKLTGQYEALVCGTDLTREEFEKAEAAFEQNGGRRKSNLAPEGSPTPCLAANGNAANVRFKEKLANGSGTYFVNTAQTKSDALAFLKKERVDKPSTYVVVDTPEGNIGRDINGIYEE